MDLELLDKIKRLAIVSMFSDDELMERLVLKGGNALDIVHRVADRASLDLDFSIEGDFKPSELGPLKEKITGRLTETFANEDLYVFDVSFAEKPTQVSADMADFWGGYQIEFKVIPRESIYELDGSQELMRKRAIETNPRHHKKFRIEISKFEFCSHKEEADLDGYTIYVYSPIMIVIEKLRAICQQMKEYDQTVHSPSRAARARDFFDIYTVLQACDVDLTSETSTQLLESIFEAKRVPLAFLANLGEYREYHRPDFDAVKDTVKPEVELQDFDFYFDYVLEIARSLEILWKVQPPLT